MKAIGVKGLRWRIWDRLDLETLLAWKNLKEGASISNDVEILIPFAWRPLQLLIMSSLRGTYTSPTARRCVRDLTNEDLQHSGRTLVFADKGRMMLSEIWKDT
jgi:hypothetical protein